MYPEPVSVKLHATSFSLSLRECSQRTFPESICLTNILAQATYTGLTSLLMISRVVKELPDFPLVKFSTSVGEVSVVTTALQKIRGHLHYMLYSTQEEKNAVISTLYKHTAYICMRLLIKVLGEVSLESYAGQENFAGLRYKAKADAWITDYTAKKASADVSRTGR